jgi:hypothetical protein
MCLVTKSENWGENIWSLSLSTGTGLNEEYDNLTMRQAIIIVKISLV